MATASSSNLRLQQISTDDSQSEFVAFRASMRLPIAPVWAADGSAGGASGTGGMEGVKEVLASWVMRYLPPLRAVLLTFDPLPTFAHQTESFPASKSPFARRRNANRMLESDGDDSVEEQAAEEAEVKKVQLKVLPMIEGSGFGLANVEFKGMAWRPRVGQKIVGSPTLSTPSHISLLLHNLFNASIPASHIPSDTYHFDPDFPVPEAIQKRQKLSFPTAAPAEEPPAVEEKAEVDDEEARAELEDREVGVEIEEEKEEEVDEEAQEEEACRERGWWRHNVTNEPLGGAEGRIEFTIVGITVANSMISLTGSLLPDPFSPAATAATSSAVAPKIKKLAARAAKAADKAAKASSKKRARAAESESNAGADSDDSVSSRSPSPPALQAPPKVEPDAESEEEAEVPPKKKARKEGASSSKSKKEKSSSSEGKDGKKKSKKVKA